MGHPNPIMLRDADFGPIRLRGVRDLQPAVRRPKQLLEQLVGTDAQFETEEVTELMRGFIATNFADLVGSSQIAALDLAANYSELSGTLREKVVEQIDDEYGLVLPQLLIVNVSLPENVQEALDTRSSMGVIGDMQRFQQYQMGQAMTKAAENTAVAAPPRDSDSASASPWPARWCSPTWEGWPPAAPPPPVQRPLPHRLPCPFSGTSPRTAALSDPST